MKGLGQGWLAAVAGGLITLLGCATLPPQGDLSRTIAIPDAWEALGESTPTDPRKAIPDGESWWTSFGDSRLDRLVAEVLKSNLDLQAAAARVDAALAQARIAGAALQPQVPASLNAARREQVFIGLPIPGQEDRALSNTSTSIGSSLDISWEADLWGKLRNAKDGASALAAAAAADFAAARLSLAGQTAKAWFAMLEAEEQLALWTEVLTSRRTTSEQIRRRYERGLRSALDLRLARSSEAAAVAVVAARRQQLDSARRQIHLLASRYPSGDPDLAPGGSLPTLPPPVPADLPSALVTRRPDLLSLERRLAAAGFRVSEARASLYPRFRLTGSVGTLSSEVEDVLDDDFSVWSLAAGLLQPLFQGGRLRAGVNLAQAQLEETAAAYAQTVLRAFSEVELMLVAESSLSDQYDALKTAAVEAEAADRLARDRYLNGLSDYLSVLESQRQSALAQSQLLEMARRRLARRVDLHLALGGSWSGNLKTHSARVGDPATAEIMSPGKS
jgi:NodT family efflux transporter outer membrane factor (OMF) lipoprotein